ncbi:MAG: hypothetical protein GOU99_01145 [Candidatus Altiarchaeota archaeon]|nr:hypothetical protein [Candidatus Altiarchaeota archaeon]
MGENYSLSVGAFIFLLSFIIFFPLMVYLSISIAQFDLYFFCNPGELSLSTERDVFNVSIELYPSREIIVIGDIMQGDILLIETNASYAVASYQLSDKLYRVACG